MPVDDKPVDRSGSSYTETTLSASHDVVYATLFRTGGPFGSSIND